MNRTEHPSTIELPEIRTDVQLDRYNTLGVPSVADRFLVLSSSGQLPLLYRRGDLDGAPWVLGGGSNVLLARRIHRLVIKNEIRFRQVVSENERSVLVRVGAGVNWHELVSWCVRKELGGLENLALIPGTVGAAPIQNIGAYGVELEDRFVELDAFDLQTGEFRLFDRQACEFAYRDSLFKREGDGRYVVTSVTLRLDRPPHRIVRSYRALDERLRNHGIHEPGISDIFESVVAIRREKLPDPARFGNAGSFFKNPIVDRERLETIRTRYPDIPWYEVSDRRVKIPAAWLIEKTGWKGRRIGDVGVYENQALVLVNHGGADGEAFLELANAIQQSVSGLFEIDLVPEVRRIE